MKRDAIPGFINEVWAIVEEPGIYRGQCAELCGIEHGFMPVVVHAVEREEYDAWYAAKQDEARVAREMANNVVTLSESLEAGEQIYTTTCIACHQPNGTGLPPAFPALAGSAWHGDGCLRASIESCPAGSSRHLYSKFLRQHHG